LTMCEQAVCDEGAHGGEGRVALMIGAEQKLLYSLTYLLLTSDVLTCAA
jgi:hypothetical protein